MSDLQEAKLAVMRAVSHVEKDAYNDYHKYDYASSEGVKAMLKPALQEAGLTVTPVFSLESLDQYQSKQSEVSFLATVACALTVCHAASGEQEASVAIGCGSDKADKAIAKAETQALKYALISLFLLPMGIDPEGDTESDEDPPEKHRKQHKQAGGGARNRRESAKTRPYDPVAVVAADPLAQDLCAQAQLTRQQIGEELDKAGTLDQLKRNIASNLLCLAATMAETDGATVPVVALKQSAGGSVLEVLDDGRLHCRCGTKNCTHRQFFESLGA